MKLIKLLLAVVLFFIIGLIFYSNYNLYYSPRLVTYGSVLVDEDLIKQLNYLKKSLNDGIAYKLQKQYP
jgi:hypothetical protein